MRRKHLKARLEQRVLQVRKQHVQQRQGQAALLNVLAVDEREHVRRLILVAGGDKVQQLRRNLDGVVPALRVFADEIVGEEDMVLGGVTGGGARLLVAFPQPRRLRAAAAHARVEPQPGIRQFVVQLNHMLLEC